MKRVREQTEDFTTVLAELLARTEKLEREVFALEKMLHGNERKKGQLHTLEVNQRDLLEREEARLANLSDPQLQEELEKKYGVTKWAEKLIHSMIRERQRGPDRSKR